MTLPAWQEVAIDKRHNRRGFDCGEAELNTFLAQYARQAHEAGSAKTYCAVEASDGTTILGFYTISPGQVELHSVPMTARPKGAGRHPLGGFRLARLAVSARYQGRRLGGKLLARAVERCMKVSRDVGGTALLIDAKDERAAGWYRMYGAVPLDDRPLSLVLPYVTFNQARVAVGLPPIL